MAIVIEDMAMNEELDRKALTAVRGGSASTPQNTPEGIYYGPPLVSWKIPPLPPIDFPFPVHFPVGFPREGVLPPSGVIAN